MLVRVWRKGSPLLVGVKIGAASVENNMEVSKKRRRRRSSNLNSEYLSKGMKN